MGSDIVNQKTHLDHITVSVYILTKSIIPSMAHAGLSGNLRLPEKVTSHSSEERLTVFADRLAFWSEFVCRS